tara:strand:- start:22516 stop:23175 length:660 start_codon:yes stop_codon:yes gene_type:complete
MKLLIKFPTRNRVPKFLKTLSKYVRYIENKDTRILVTCDNDDETMQQEFVKDAIDQYDNVEVCYGNNKSKIDAINADLEGVNFDIVLLASDDMIPMEKGFDNIIIDKMKNYYPDTDGVLWFNDGYQGDKLNTLCILGKKYYDRFGYIYNPEYISVWSDNEFMDVGNLLNKQTYFSDIIIKHEHPDWGFGNRDEIHSLNSKYEAHDRGIYNKRKEINFEL